MASKFNTEHLSKISLLILAFIIIGTVGINTAAATSNNSTTHVNVTSTNNTDNGTPMDYAKLTTANTTGTVADNGTIILAQANENQTGNSSAILNQEDNATVNIDSNPIGENTTPATPSNAIPGNDDKYLNADNYWRAIYNPNLNSPLNGIITLNFFQVLDSTVNRTSIQLNGNLNLIANPMSMYLRDYNDTVNSTFNYKNAPPSTSNLGTIYNVNDFTRNLMNLNKILMHGQDKPLSREPIYFSVNDNNSTNNTTNSHGEPSLPYKDNLISVNYNITAVFKGSRTYLNEGSQHYDSDLAPHTKPLIISKIDPPDNAWTNNVNKVITAVFNKNIQMGTGCIDFTTNNGTAIPYNTTIKRNLLTIKPLNPLIHDTRYTITLQEGCVVDNAGNTFQSQSSSFIVDTSPLLITHVRPEHNSVISDVNKVVTLNFNKKIQIGNGWFDFNTNTGIPLPYSISVNGKILTLTPENPLSNDVQYIVTLHTGSVTDAAGNIKHSYSSGFTVRYGIENWWLYPQLYNPY